MFQNFDRLPTTASFYLALAQMDAHESSQMGILTIGYYIVTMAIATAVSPF